MKNSFYAPLAEDFIRVRYTGHFTQKNVSDMLHVTLETIRNWEEGRASIPYSAFKLLKVLANYELPFEGWEGWCINRNLLWSPAGRSFEPHQLAYIGNYFTMARFWLAEREKMRQHQITIAQTPQLRVIQGGKSLQQPSSVASASTS